MIIVPQWVLITIGFFMAVSTCVTFLLIAQLRRLEWRYEQFREQCTVMIASHQDALHSHEGRLQRLGSPSPPGMHIPPADDLMTQERR